MEWVETTAKTIEEAQEAALDRLGVAADEAEFEIIEEPRPGLFGRVRGEARLRARVRPAAVRPKQERRRSRRGESASASASGADAGTSPAPAAAVDDQPRDDAGDTSPKRRTSRPKASSPRRPERQETPVDQEQSTVSPQDVGAAAGAFMEGLTTAFGTTGTLEVHIEDQEIDVTVSGSELGLLVGPGGRTLNAIQDLARVAAQRRLGDHETRLRIDVAGYRQRREAALTEFAQTVADQVRTSGVARSLEPMSSADRKVVHDTVNEQDGVTSRSIGDDPDRRIIVEPA
jgi:spoIIIJ-associated protein